MAIPTTARKLTEAEYLALERAADFRSAFLVNQHFPRAEQFVQREGEWLLRKAEGMGGTLSLPFLKVTIQLSEVFA